MLENPMLNSVLFESFKTWGTKYADPKYIEMYKRLDDLGLDIIKIAFNEIDPKPGLFDWWWTKEHMRFAGKIKDQQMRVVRPLMYTFLTKCARGTLQDDIESYKIKNPPKKRRRATETVG